MPTATTERAAAPRPPERKWGPFHGGLSVCVWLNLVKDDQGERYFRSVSISPRRFRDEKTGEWKDANSLRPVDLPSLLLALEAAHAYVRATPLPGLSADDEEAPDNHAESEPPRF